MGSIVEDQDRSVAKESAGRRLEENELLGDKV
jgi:hypothetical protein